MPEPIIIVENLSKLYRIGVKEKGYKTIRESIIDGLTAPIRNLKRLRKLTKFNDVKSNPLPSAPCPVPSPSEDTIWAIKDISFKVQPGEVVGIIGRNGAGKSTILKILSRITEPTTGDVKIYGRVASLLEVGTGFHPELTGRENVFLNGAILGMRKSEIKKKFDEIVNFAEIEKFLDTPVKRYSSGMRVRLAFAVAAHLEPEVLLVDEVLAVGDAGFQKKCLGKIKSIGRGGRTVFIVSHNMGVINQLCSRGLVIENGRLAISSTPEKAIAYYLEEARGGNLPEITFPLQKELSAQILSASVLNSSGAFISQLHYKDDFEIRIRIEVRRPSDKYHTLFLIRDVLGNGIVQTTDKDIANSSLTNIKGQCEYKIRFPAKLFKPGQYYTRIMLIHRDAGRALGGTVLSDNERFQLGFEIVDVESRRARENRYADTAIALELPWHFIPK